MKNCIKIDGKKAKRLILAGLLFAAGCGLFLGHGFEESQGLKESRKDSLELHGVMQEKMQERACQTYLPVFSFLEENVKREKDTTFLETLFGSMLPLYEYIETKSTASMQVQEGGLAEELAEGRDLHEKDGDVELDILEAVKRENENADFEKGEEGGEGDTTSLGKALPFQEAEKVAVIDRKALQDFDKLVSELYAVDSTTYIGRDQLNVKKLSDPDMTLQQIDASKPQILIYHTHSQEGFADSVPGDDSTTIIGAGEKLAGLLRDRYGFNVLHHTGKYDVESRDYAYSNAAPALEQILEENPSIEVVIDLHRDQMPEETRLVTDLEGRPTARFMFFNGLSRTNKTGEIAYLENPNLDTNLAFSFQMQMAAGEHYPGLTRKIYLKGYRYNMQYRGKTLLIELGAQNNTVEEIMNACDPLAHILSLVLSGET